MQTPYSLLEEDLSISRNREGSIVISAMLPEQIVSKTFIFYSEEEAIENFISWISDGIY